MCNHRSFALTSDVAKRRSASGRQGYHGRFPVLLLIVGLATIGLTSKSAIQAAEPLASRPLPNVAGTSATDASDPLLNLVDEAITRNSHRFLDSNRHSPWLLAHGYLALRRDLQVRHDGQMLNAIDWLSNKATFKGTPILQATPWGGEAHPYNGVPHDFEGHINQTLALLTLANLPLSHTFTLVDGKRLTMADFVNSAKMKVNQEEETTWTLWFLTHYLDPEAQWVNQHGHQWGMINLVDLQNKVVTTKAPCGGTHNLFALAYARNAYLQKHGRLRSVWLEADRKIQLHIQSVRALQNADGSFSTEFFKGRGFSEKFDVRMKSTGHNLEWLMMALPQNRLQEEWVRSAVRSLAQDLIKSIPHPVDYGEGKGGTLYHSIDALVLYRQRVSQPETFSPTTPLMALKNATKSPVIPELPNPVAQHSAPEPTSKDKPSVVVTPTPAVEQDSASNSASTAPRPLTLSINGRPIRVAELPTTGHSDSPQKLMPLPDSLPADSTQPEPLPAPVSPGPADDPSAAPVTTPPAAQATDTPEAVSNPATDKPVPSPYGTKDGSSAAAQLSSPLIPESLNDATSTLDPKPEQSNVVNPEIAETDPVAQPAELPTNPQPLTPANPAPATEKAAAKPSDGTPESAPTVTAERVPMDAEAPAARDGEAARKPAPQPVPTLDNGRTRPRVHAPRDVFVPLRRRYLPPRN